MIWLAGKASWMPLIPIPVLQSLWSKESTKNGQISRIVQKVKGSYFQALEMARGYFKRICMLQAKGFLCGTGLFESNPHIIFFSQRSFQTFGVSLGFRSHQNFWPRKKKPNEGGMQTQESLSILNEAVHLQPYQFRDQNELASGSPASRN